MEEQLSLLKKSLISLVVSSPTTMTVSRLLKDYRSLVGGVLPLAKFGYKEPLPFLRERCTDIFVIEGPPRDPILTPKVTKNLAHIDQMVQKQKVQSTLKHKGKRRSILQHVEGRPITKYSEPNRYDPPAFNQSNRYDAHKHDTSSRYNTPKYDTSSSYSKNPPNFKETNRVTQTQDAECKTQGIIKENNNKQTDIKNGFHHESNNNGFANNSSFDNNEKRRSSNSVEEFQPNSALTKFYKKRLPQYNSEMDFPSPVTEQFRGSVDSGRHSSGSGSSKRALLDELKEEIMELIIDSVEGVWCADLIRLYKERYGRELKHSQLGHTSVISLVYSMDERIAVARPAPDGDWLLQEASRAVPVQAAPCRPRRAPRSPPPPEPGDALPGVDFEADVFPADCLHYVDCIPGAPLEGLARGVQLEVLVGEVYSPSHFWMLRVGPRHNLAMEHLMDEMTEYYRGAGAARVLARGAVREGQYCASLFDNDWHRSLIVSVVDSDTVKVRHVDYGTVDTVDVAQLKPLRREWGSLPAQAIRARLAACRPAAAGWRWPRAACAAFLQRVRDTRLYANVLQVDLEEDIVETFLIDTTGPEDVCLTRELIRVGHADARTDSALDVSVHEAGCAGAGESVDVRSLASSVRRFGDVDSCSASQVAGPALRLADWQADDEDASSVLSRGLARRVGRLRRLGAPAPAPAASESDSSGDSTATVVSSRVLLRKLQITKSHLNDDAESDSSGFTASAASVSSRLLRRKVELYDKHHHDQCQSIIL